MVKKATDAINEIKLWLFIPLAGLVVFFLNGVYSTINQTSRTVNTIQSDLKIYIYKVESLKDQFDEEKRINTEELFKNQLERHATKNDTTTD